MSILEEENRKFNAAVHRMLEWDNTPGSEPTPISKSDVAECLRLIWKHIGGEVWPSYAEEQELRGSPTIKR